MNATVAAAVISVSGVVIVGVAGFGAAIWSTRKVSADARESRIWDQRAAVYVEALAAVNYRQARRNHVARGAPAEEPTTQQALASLAAGREFDWHGLEARLQAFAAEPVVTAMQISSTASERAMIAHRARIAAGDGSEARKAVAEALRAADAADDDVIELIRTGLQGRGKGKPLADWQPITGSGQRPSRR